MFIKEMVLRESPGSIGKSSDNGAKLSELEFTLPDFWYVTLGKLLHLCELHPSTQLTEEF